MSQEKSLNLPPLNLEDESEKVVQVTEVADSPPSPPVSDQEVIDRLIAVIRKEHEHIGKGLVLMWGHPECEQYLHNLIDGGDNGNRPQKNRSGSNHLCFPPCWTWSNATRSYAISSYSANRHGIAGLAIRSEG